MQHITHKYLLPWPFPQSRIHNLVFGRFTGFELILTLAQSESGLFLNVRLPKRTFWASAIDSIDQPMAHKMMPMMSLAVPNLGSPPGARDTAGEFRITTGKETVQTCGYILFNLVIKILWRYELTQRVWPIQKPGFSMRHQLVSHSESGKSHTQEFEQVRTDIIKPSVTSSLQDAE